MSHPTFCSLAVQSYYNPATAGYTEVFMEKFAALLIPALMTLILFRLLWAPMRLFYKLAANSACGFLCLWLLNTVSGFTGVYLPINAVTVLTAGFTGLPGIGLIALLEIL